MSKSQVYTAASTNQQSITIQHTQRVIEPGNSIDELSHRSFQIIPSTTTNRYSNADNTLEQLYRYRNSGKKMLVATNTTIQRNK